MLCNSVFAAVGCSTPSLISTYTIVLRLRLCNLHQRMSVRFHTFYDVSRPCLWDSPITVLQTVGLQTVPRELAWEPMSTSPCKNQQEAIDWEGSVWTWHRGHIYRSFRRTWSRHGSPRARCGHTRMGRNPVKSCFVPEKPPTTCRSTLCEQENRLIQ